MKISTYRMEETKKLIIKVNNAQIIVKNSYNLKTSTTLNLAVRFLVFFF